MKLRTHEFENGPVKTKEHAKQASVFVIMTTIMAVGAQNDLGGQQTFARKMT